MTTYALLEGANSSVTDMVSKMSLSLKMIEMFLKDQLDIPEAVNFPQMLILARMTEFGRPVRPGDIQKKHWYSGSNATYNIKNLIAGQYLSQDVRAGDRRTRWLSLTLHGRQLGAEVLERLQYIEQNIGIVYPDDQFRTLVKFLGGTLHTPPPASLPLSRKSLEEA